MNLASKATRLPSPSGEQLALKGTHSKDSKHPNYRTQTQRQRHAGEAQLREHRNHEPSAGAIVPGLQPETRDFVTARCGCASEERIRGHVEVLQRSKAKHEDEFGGAVVEVLA